MPRGKSTTASEAQKNAVKEKRNKIYKLSTGKKNAVTFIKNPQTGVPAEDKNGKSRFMRLCNNYDSIWMEEQKGESAVERTLVQMQDGQMFVHQNESRLQEFLDRHPDNEENGGRVFKEYRPWEEKAEKMAEEDLRDDALIEFRKLRDSSLPKLEGVAKARGIDVKRRSAEWLYDLRLFVKKDPKEFMSMLSDPFVECKTLVIGADEEGHIDTKSDKTKVTWVKTGGVILNVPSGQEPVDALANYLTTDKGLSTREELEKLMK